MKTETQTRLGTDQTIDTYADGSIRVTTVQKPAPATPSGVHVNASIGSCTTVSSSHYDATYRCTVSTNVVVSNAAYTVTYHQVQGAASSITANSPLTTSCSVGACSNKRMVVGRKTQSGNSPAYITGYWTWTAVGGGSSKDYWLEFDVRNGSTWASNN
ncbi:hypothetical protein P9139_04450 [Curtobacterium flaccumfaciens]|nr:hypothetical protein P9139_04450 [Curtobacterium flaccumfaciens]